MSYKSGTILKDIRTDTLVEVMFCSIQTASYSIRKADGTTTRYSRRMIENPHLYEEHKGAEVIQLKRKPPTPRTPREIAAGAERKIDELKQVILDNKLLEKKRVLERVTENNKVFKSYRIKH